MNKFFSWAFSSMARTYFSIAILAIGIGIASAATTYDVVNAPQMYLGTSITATQTTGITISALGRNGVRVTFPVTSGAILRIRSGSYVEDILYTSASVNATTKIVTLSGVTRDICWNVFNRHTTCSAGRSFPKGSIVELSNDARLFNFKANLDRKNTFTASGSIFFTGSGSLGVPTFASTAERDRQLGPVPPPGNTRIACVTGTSLCYYSLGGAWTAFGNTGVGAATETALGTSELGTVTDIKNHVISGDAGTTIITVNLVTRTSTGSTQANKIPALGANGVMSGGLLGRNIASVTRSNSGTLFLRADQNFSAITATTNLANSGSMTISSSTTGSVLLASHSGTTFFNVLGTMKNGHIRIGGKAPTFSGECTASANTGNDTIGKFTIDATTTRCAMYFNKSYTTAPVCVVSPSKDMAADTRTVTTQTGMIVLNSVAMNTSVISYICLEF